MNKNLHFRSVLTVVLVSLVGALAVVAYANHSWGGYHWGRTANPFTLKLGDNVSSGWDAYLATTSDDWSLSSVLDTVVVAGANSRPKNCRATNGRVEVCSTKYGYNGWLGVASIWVSGNHIVQGVVKMNDTYFSTSKYNTPAWRNLVMCQEVGHTLGLDHQDENFDNDPLGSCMDYSSDPNLNQHPNQHDYDQLELIYAHLDAVSTVDQSLSSSAANADFSGPGQWGREVHKSSDGRTSLYERNLGNGQKVFTFVVWAN